METKRIKQEVEFDASAHEVFELIMDSKKHAGFTDSECVMSRKVGGMFSCYEGYIEGKNLEIVKDKKIVQKWRGSEFPKGHWSKVTFEFKEKGGKTLLKFTHEDVPAELFDSISDGWKEHYWDKMKKSLKRDF